MTLMTPQSLISLALRAIGVLGEGQIASAEANTDGFNVLNGMMGQWNRRRWMIYQEVDYAIPVTGAQSYTVGPGANLSIPRVDRLEFAYYRQFAQNAPGQQFVDFPLRLCPSYEDYSRIALKELTSWPTKAFFDSGYPVGTLYVNPIPTVLTDAIHIGVKQHIAQFSALVQSINLPDEYVETIWTNLAVRAAAIFPGSVLTDDTRGLAMASMALIQTANTQIPTMSMPTGLTRRPLYNIFSGQIY
jgi:hypothetical protein